MALADDQAQWRWFIDAWLPVDGIVFLSLRGPRTDIWQDEGAGDAVQAAAATALFLRAPLFEPETIERRLAFGAVQRGAQEGFSLDGVGEFGFESVEQVIAFVRRVYTGGGPPRTTGGAAPAPVPGGPDREGDGQPWPELDMEPGANADAAWSLAYDESEDGAALGHKMASACSATVRRAAANLLIRSMRATLFAGEAGDRFGTVMPQLLAALLLTSDADRFWLDRFARAIGNEREGVTDALRKSDLGMIAAVVWDYFNAPSWFVPALDSGRFDWRRGWIREAPARPLHLPAHVDNGLDALCYVCADRRYLCRQPFSAWGPLLLALTAPWAIAAGWGRRGGDGWGDAWLPLVARSMHMAAALLPAQALPSSLEDNIERWCRRLGTDAARSTPPSRRRGDPTSRRSRA